MSLKSVDRVEANLASQKGQKAEGRDVKEIILAIKDKTLIRVKDPHFQTVAISTGGGAIILGGVGGAFGAASGMVIGGTVGALPALFTFGLSLPVCGTIGAGMGLCAGGVVGGGAGALCGGAAGEGAWRYRVEIKDGMMYVRARAVSSVDKAKLTILDKTEYIKTTVNTKKDSAVSLTKEAKAKLAAKLTKAYEASLSAAHDRRVQVTAAAAAGGAAMGAPVGGTVGVCSGAVAGGVIGLPAALFTFGLSVPFCAVVGGGMGLCAGTVTGGCVGAVGGGSVGFGGYTYRKQIAEKKDEVQKKIVDSAAFAKESVKKALSGTGGTA